MVTASDDIPINAPSVQSQDNRNPGYLAQPPHPPPTEEGTPPRENKEPDQTPPRGAVDGRTEEQLAFQRAIVATSDAGPPAESLPERLVWDVQDPLDGFSVGHQKSSETKCLRHFAQTDDSVVYLDAPGYVSIRVRTAAFLLACLLG